MKESLVLGLSGGVDSAVAAALLKDTYAITCVYLDIGLGLGGKEDAATLADALNLPFQTVNIQEALEREVCQNFIAEYLLGRTPLPCARCNPRVKFPALAQVADQIGAKWLATGHYARTLTQNQRTLLLRGKSPNDQSYMLARLPQKLLSRILFPLGGMEKSQIREHAQALGLSVANKPDSMEICFIPQGDYPSWIHKRGMAPPPGDFVEAGTGKILGQHQGIHHYTLGQGRGLKVSGPHRYFVSDILPHSNQVILSDGKDLMANRIFCSRPNWISIENWEKPLSVTVKVRHSKVEASGIVEQKGERIELITPIRVPTPGQLAVFYEQDIVVGSAWIEGYENAPVHASNQKL